jgi:uncharacterized protein involved in exopolysaccharide biosynthesis
MATLARFRWIVAATVLGLLAGFLVSYLFNPKYSSRARIEEFSDAGDRWTSFITPDSQTEFMVFQQRALSPNNLRPVIEREGVAKSEGAETVYGELVKNARFQLASSDDAAPYTAIDIDLIYTDSNPQRAEQLCNVLTSGVLDESKADSQRAIGDTTYILEQALKDAKNDVQDIHGRLLKRPSDRKLAREYAKAQEAYADLAAKRKEAAGPEIFIGGTYSLPQRVRVRLPCDIPTTPDFPNRPLCAALGSATGLLVGIALCGARRNSLGQVAEPQR